MGMERLQDIVTTRRRKMAGHVLRLHRTYSNIYWVSEDGRRKRGRPEKTWRSTFKEDLEKWVLAGMEPAGSQITV